MGMVPPGVQAQLLKDSEEAGLLLVCGPRQRRDWPVRHSSADALLPQPLGADAHPLLPVEDVYALICALQTTRKEEPAGEDTRSADVSLALCNSLALAILHGGDAGTSLELTSS